MEFGLIDKWIRLENAPALNANARAHQQKDESEKVVLTIHHIVGALLIMAFGYILAIIVFLAEQVVYRRIRWGSQSKLLLALHKFFRPNRIDCMVTPFPVKKI